MTTQLEPHLLHFFVSDEGNYEYSIDCPYGDNSRDRSCALYEECTQHPIPTEPESECPPYRWTEDNRIERDEDGHWLYAVDADPVAVQEWMKYDQELEAWEAMHVAYGNVGFHRHDGRCWVQYWVYNEAITDGWDLVGFEHVEVISPMPVRWSNRGSVDDSYLELSPWESDEKAHDA